MPLNDDYLVYEHRGYGMDQGLYAWRPATTRAPIAWPAGKTVAVTPVVPLEFHMLDPKGKPFKHPGAMQTPYPDLRHYTTRDYGLRVGAFRILKELNAAGLKATFPINAVLLERARPLVDAILDGGHEIAAYGLDTDHIHWGGLEIDVERAWIADTCEAFARAGLNPTTWMSPARQQSFNTPELLAEAGFTTCLDWEQDTVPVAMKTAAGAITAVPLSNELDDRSLLIDRRQTEDQWVTQVRDAVAYLAAEAPRAGSQSLAFTLTSYVTGQPFRIHALRELLAGLAADPAVWSATAAEVAAAAG
jgi:hypothetical protein